MPADYINKLARMFQDIKVSNDLNQAFKTEYMNKGDIAGKAYKVSHLCCDSAGIKNRRSTQIISTWIVVWAGITYFFYFQSVHAR